MAKTNKKDHKPVIKEAHGFPSTTGKPSGTDRARVVPQPKPVQPPKKRK